MYRNRAWHRIRKLKTLAVRLHGHQEGVAGVAMQEVVLESSGMQRPGAEPTQLMQPACVRLTDLPVYRPTEYILHDAFEPGESGDFSMLQPLPYKAEFEYKLLRYTIEESPGLIPYVAPSLDQPLITGATEESCNGLPGGVLPAGLADEQQMDLMPQGLMGSPYKSLEIGSRYSNDKVLVPLSPFWLTDAEALLQPQLYSYHDSVAYEVAGSSSIRAMAAAPLRSQIWLPLQNPWHAASEAVPDMLAGWAQEDGPAAGSAHEDIDKPQVAIKYPDLQPYCAVSPTSPRLLPQSQSSSNHLTLERQIRQQQVDGQKTTSRESAVQQLKSSVDAYNAQLAKPYRSELQ
eukprot:GHRR01018785.1.p1 GENE.GHRR01018785.1~~GHRR01018785.1.p1  ORF type:complete len:346 (+),score=104.55 GHRR01018785.1:2868-3905(+)